MYVDDFLCRGSKGDSDKFYEALMSKFDCKDPTFLGKDQDIIFTGMTISRECANGRLVNVLSQSNEIKSFLKLKGIWDVRSVDSPMPDRNTMLGGDTVNDNVKSWCKSVIGGLQHFVRCTRWDISHAVSRLGQQLENPTVGTVKQIDRIAGYMKSSIARRLQGYHGMGDDVLMTYTDSDHHGDPKNTSRSQTSVMCILNGVPVHWRSNRQPKTTLSPAESEIYALSVGIKDAQLTGWVLEEMGATVSWPINIYTDSAGAYSFQRDANPETKLRGCFDFRERWVSELQEADSVNVQLCPDDDNLADIGTKCLATYKYKRRVQQLEELELRGR
jgi:hypothetical protein